MNSKSKCQAARVIFGGGNACGFMIVKKIIIVNETSSTCSYGVILKTNASICVIIKLFKIVVEEWDMTHKTT